MKKGSKLCHITCLDGSVHHAFFTEAERKALTANTIGLTISGRNIGHLRSIDETHFEEMKTTLPNIYNTLLSAPTRSGKGVSNVIPTLLSWSEIEANLSEVF